MKGSVTLSICTAIILTSVAVGTRADKSKKNFKKFPPPLPPRPGQGPPGRPLAPPLPLPRIPPFLLGPSLKQKPSTLDPYSCLPKYLCIIQDQNGEKRTTIVHGLHPALRKANPSVIDPENLPKLPGGTRPFPRPRPFVSEVADDEKYRDREFNDAFLKHQDMVEAMAFVEEKRRQFMYQQGLPKTKIIPKTKRKKTVPLVAENDKQSKESSEDEEKSKETSKEETDKSVEASKEQETDKSAEASKEKETDKSAEVSKEQETEKSAEASKEEEDTDNKSVEEEEKEEKEEPEESAEDASSESSKSKSNLKKYKIKNKMHSKKRNSAFRARMDDYEDVDTLHDHLATVPWDDRLRNDTDPLKPEEIYDKLFGQVLPVFQLPIIGKLAKSIPGISLLTSSYSDEVTTTTTTTTPRPGLFKRMLNRVTGGGTKVAAAPAIIRRRNGRPVRRYRRDAKENLKKIAEDENARIVKQIKDPEKQCRMIFKGCDLPYEHIMKMVSTGQVLIESDADYASPTKKPVVVEPAFTQDDEFDQAERDKMPQKKAPKPISQLLAQATLGGKKKVSEMSVYGKNKKKPMKPAPQGSSEESSQSSETETFPMPKPKKAAVASLPLMPMKYNWGKPTYSLNGKPASGLSEFSGGVIQREIFNKPTTTTTTTTTTPRPIFAPIPLDIRDNLTAPLLHSVIKVNKTHAVHVLSKKPYNPPKTRTRDSKGQPVSFNSVFTEIAGQTGGIHDFFDRISGAFGGDGEDNKESGRGRDFLSTFPGSNHDVHGNVEQFPTNAPKVSKPKKPASKFPSAAELPIHVEKIKNEEKEQLNEEDSGSEEDQEEADNEDQEEEEHEKEPAPQKPQRPSSQLANGQHADKRKKPEKTSDKDEEEDEDDNQEESEEEDRENDEQDLPDNLPPYVRQAMIEDLKRKKHEQLQGATGQQHRGRRPGRPQQPFGRPGQNLNLPPQGKPPRRNGGFLSSLFS